MKTSQVWNETKYCAETLSLNLHGTRGRVSLVHPIYWRDFLGAWETHRELEANELLEHYESSPKGNHLPSDKPRLVMTTMGTHGFLHF